MANSVDIFDPGATGSDRVAKAGDTMTGDLLIEQDSTANDAGMLKLNSTEAGGSEQIEFFNQGVRRAEILDHEGTGSLRMQRSNGAGLYLFDDFARFSKRVEGRLTVASDSTTTLTSKEYVDYRNRAHLVDRSAETNQNVATDALAYNKATLGRAVLNLPGMYKLSWSVKWSMSDLTSIAEMYINWNSSAKASMLEKASAVNGAGPDLENIGGAGTLNAGTNTRSVWSGFTVLNVPTADGYDIDLDVHSFGGGVLGIYDPMITVEWFSEP